MKMNPRVKLLKEMVSDDLYVIDAVAVADAVLLRSKMRHMLPDVTFRGTPRRSRRCAPVATTAARSRFA